MFLHLSVILFTGGSASVHTGTLPPPREGSTPPGRKHPLSPRGGSTPPRESAAAADGTHPTGMHSCHTVFGKNSCQTVGILTQIQGLASTVCKILDSPLKLSDLTTYQVAWCSGWKIRDGFKFPWKWGWSTLQIDGFISVADPRGRSRRPALPHGPNVS